MLVCYLYLVGRFQAATAAGLVRFGYDVFYLDCSRVVPRRRCGTSLRDFAAVLAWSKAKEEDLQFVLGLIGDETMDDFTELASIPIHLIIECISEWVKQKSPPPLQQSRSARFINVVRLKSRLEPEDLLPVPPPQAAPTPDPQILAEPAGKAKPEDEFTVKVKIGQVLDQGSDQEVPMLSMEKLLEVRRKYLETMGGPPLQRAEVTDSQITALHFRDKGGQAPFADFGIWGSFGTRAERKRKFTSYVLTPTGLGSLLRWRVHLPWKCGETRGRSSARRPSCSTSRRQRLLMITLPASKNGAACSLVHGISAHKQTSGAGLNIGLKNLGDRRNGIGRSLASVHTTLRDPGTQRSGKLQTRTSFGRRSSMIQRCATHWVMDNAYQASWTSRWNKSRGCHFQRSRKDHEPITTAQDVIGGTFVTAAPGTSSLRGRKLKSAAIGTMVGVWMVLAQISAHTQSSHGRMFAQTADSHTGPSIADRRCRRVKGKERASPFQSIHEDKMGWWNARDPHPPTKHLGPTQAWSAIAW